MSFVVGELVEKTSTELFIEKKGWNSRLSDDEINVETCPLPDPNYDNAPCGAKWKFYINRNTGWYKCHKCNGSGNMFKLKQQTGDIVATSTGTTVISGNQGAIQQRQPDPLPNVEAAHQALLANDEVMNYLNDVRGWSPEIISRMKLGLSRAFFRDLNSEHAGLMFPYYVQGELRFAKWRSLPPARKAFTATLGRDNPLYNQDVIVHGMDELILCEGEADTLSCITNGIEYAAGVPGAGQKQVKWDKLLDHPKKLYLLFDRDDTGQKGAYEFAIRFGIDRFYNIVIPPFQKDDGTEGKDIGEWFAVGHTVEEFEVLKAQAEQFRVFGVSTSLDALDEVEKSLDERGTTTFEFQYKWPCVNARTNGYSRGHLVGWIAKGKQGKTTTVLNELDWQAERGHVAMLMCLEMGRVELAQKQVSFLSRVDMSPYSGSDVNEKIAYDTAKAKEFKQGIQIAREIIAKRKGDLLFAEDMGITKSDQVFEIMDASIKRYGVDIFAFDNLQLLCDQTIGSNMGNRSAYLSQLTKKFKAFARTRKVAMHLIMQPKKVEDGVLVTANDNDGSGAAEKDVDTMIALGRKALGSNKMADLEAVQTLEAPASFSSIMHGRVDRSRHAPGGSFKLYLEAGMSLVREMSADDDGGVPSVPIIGGGDGIVIGQMAI